MRPQPLIAVTDVEASSRWYQWFETDGFDDAVARARAMGAEVLMEPHRNPPPGQPRGPVHGECWLGHSDGYTVVLASPDRESP
jgi:hypothetical protein